MAIYDDYDVEWSWNGDFIISDGGDLSDTSDDGLKSLIQDIHSICASEFEDWEFHPKRAAGLDDFVGEPNIRSTADRIHDRIRLSLVSNGLILEEDLDIRVLPVHRHKVLVVIKINATPTPLNKLQQSEGLRVQLVFDYFEKGIFFLGQKPLLINN